MKQDGLILGWQIRELNAVPLCPPTVKADITNEVRERSPSEQSATASQPGLLYPGWHRQRSCLPVVESKSLQINREVPKGESRPREVDLPKTWGVSASVNLQPALGWCFGWVLMFGTY